MANIPGVPALLGGSRVLLTGALGGIGLVAASRRRAAGAILTLTDVLTAVDAAPFLDRTDFGAQDYLHADVRVESDVVALFDQAAHRTGAEFDAVLVHSGIVHTDALVDLPLHRFDEVIQINLRGSFLVAREAARRWRQHGCVGHLVFTTSWVADVAWPEIGAYSASKAAIRSLMRTFARELAPHGIRANAVAPGIVGVGMARRQWDTDPAYRARAQHAVPLGDLQTPESVADAMIFLVSPMAAYMTGATLLVDGGASLYPMD